MKYRETRILILSNFLIIIKTSLIDQEIENYKQIYSDELFSKKINLDLKTCDLNQHHFNFTIFEPCVLPILKSIYNRLMLI